MPDENGLDEFCDALWLEDGLSRNTLSSYRLDLTQFAAWLDKARGKALLAAAYADVLAYLAHRVAGKAKATSTSRLLSSLKRFYQYELRQGRIARDPTLNIDWLSSGFQVSLRLPSISRITRDRIPDAKVYLDRPYHKYRIELNAPEAGAIEFGAVGFTQRLRGIPVLWDEQVLTWRERNRLIGESPPQPGER